MSDDWMKYAVGKKTWTYDVLYKAGRHRYFVTILLPGSHGDAAAFDSSEEAREFALRVESGELRPGQPPAPKLSAEQRKSLEFMEERAAFWGYSWDKKNSEPASALDAIKEETPDGRD